MTTAPNEKFSVTTHCYDAYNPKPFERQWKRPMHFKAVAAYAVKVIKDPANWRRVNNQQMRKAGYVVFWPEMYLEVYIPGSIQAINFLPSGKVHSYMEHRQTNDWPGIAYIMAAMRKAVEEVQSLNDSPALNKQEGGDE